MHTSMGRRTCAIKGVWKVPVLLHWWVGMRGEAGMRTRGRCGEASPIATLLLEVPGPRCAIEMTLSTTILLARIWCLFAAVASLRLMWRLELLKEDTLRDARRVTRTHTSVTIGMRWGMKAGTKGEEYLINASNGGGGAALGAADAPLAHAHPPSGCQQLRVRLTERLVKALLCG